MVWGGMESIDQTIAAVCTATPAEGSPSRSIVRISGPEAFNIIEDLCRPAMRIDNRGIQHASIELSGATLDAMIYGFPSPHSYTGQDVAELHLDAPPVVVEAVLSQILRRCRQARPGEFTLRAYLSGRMDLSQAEAVAQVVAAGNRLQLEAARRMLEGRLSETLSACREELLNLLSEIEAGLDFSTEDIPSIPIDQAIQQLVGIQNRIQSILDESIHGEELMDLPSVGLAGFPNAGKSSLMNALLGRLRSLVSPVAETTRDVLEAEWILPHGRCVLFDCAGLLNQTRPDDILEQLAQRAAEDALRSASILLFCADGSKPDWSEDLALFRRIGRSETLVVMTQRDRWTQTTHRVLDRAQQNFGRPCLAVSAKTGGCIDQLRDSVDAALLQRQQDSAGSDRLALTERHRQSIRSALTALQEARREMDDGLNEVAAMLLRSAVEQLGPAQSEPIDERVLGRIFSRFCIGK
jgi:tRNA modification GTPase